MGTPDQTRERDARQGGPGLTIVAPPPFASGDKLSPSQQSATSTEPKIVEPISALNPFLDMRADAVRELLTARVKVSAQVSSAFDESIQQEKNYTFSVVDVAEAQYEVENNEKDIEFLRQAQIQLDDEDKMDYESDESEEEKEIAAILEKQRQSMEAMTEA